MDVLLSNGNGEIFSQAASAAVESAFAR